MTGLEQSRHMCDMSQGISKQKQSCLKTKREATAFNNWTKWRCLLWKNGNSIGWQPCASSLADSCGLKKRRYESTLTQLSVTNSMAKVHSSEGHQAELNGNIGIIALCFGEGALQVSTFLGTSTTPSPRLVWFLVGPAPNQMETAYDCSKNQTFKFAWRAQNARRLWTGCNGSSLCMVLVWCCNKPSQTVPLTRLLRTERSGAHLKAQMRDPIGLATGSQKEVSCNSTWIHCQLRVRQQAWRQATPLPKGPSLSRWISCQQLSNKHMEGINISPAHIDMACLVSVALLSWRHYRVTSVRKSTFNTRII